MQVREWDALLDKVKKEAASRNEDWMHVHTKPCVGCGSPIEKNGGCNHIVCTRCRRHFCWVSPKITGHIFGPFLLARMSTLLAFHFTQREVHVEDVTAIRSKFGLLGNSDGSAIKAMLPVSLSRVLKCWCSMHAGVWE